MTKVAYEQVLPFLDTSDTSLLIFLRIKSTPWQATAIFSVKPLNSLPRRHSTYYKFRDPSIL